MHRFRVVVLVALALTLLSAQARQGARPLYLQADQLVDDAGGNRVIVKGNVEIWYNQYILMADQVTYDRSANTLVAEGNAVLKHPDGTTTRTDRFDAPADFRDAFAQSLSAVSADSADRTAPR